MNKKGYTLLEVSLFLAISGLLALTAFAGLNPRLRNVRFTASVRGLQSNLTTQLTNLPTGVNTNKTIGCKYVSGTKLSFDGSVSPTPGTSGSCVLSGLLAVPSLTKITYYQIVSSLQPQTPANCTSTGFARMFCFAPTIVATAAAPSRSFSFMNGATNTSSTVPQSFGIIEDPQTGQQYSFVYSATEAAKIGASTLPLVQSGSSVASGDSTVICQSLGGRVATVTLKPGSGVAPQVTFDQGCN